MTESAPAVATSSHTAADQSLVLRPRRKNDAQLNERRRKLVWVYVVSVVVLGHNVLTDPGGTVLIVVPTLALVVGVQVVLGALYFRLATLFVVGSEAGKTDILGRRTICPRERVAAILLLPIQLQKLANPTPHHVIAFVDAAGNTLVRVNAQYWSMQDVTQLASTLGVPIAGSWDEAPIPIAQAESRHPGVGSWYERNNEAVTAASIVLVFPVAALLVWIFSVLHI